LGSILLFIIIKTNWFIKLIVLNNLMPEPKTAKGVKKEDPKKEEKEKLV
jgi:hypothetical protein